MTNPGLFACRLVIAASLAAAGPAITVVLAAEPGSGATGRGAPGQPPNPRDADAKRPPVPQILRCTPPTGESVSADVVLKEMRDGKDVDLRGKLIEGSLEADLVWPPGDDRKVSLRVIAGKVNIESSRITGRFAFPRCVFAQGLGLPCTEIRGDLDLSDSHVRGPLNAAHTRVLGEIRALRLDVSGPFSFADGVAGERIDLTSARIDGPVDFSGAELSRDIEITKAVVGGIDFSSAQVAGLTKLEDVLVLGEAAFRDGKFNEGLQIESLRSVGSLDLDGARGKGEISLRECVVGSDFLLALGVGGPVGVSGVVVARDLSLLDGRFASLTIDRARIGNGSELDGVRVAGRLSIRDSDFGKSFSATDAYFEGISEFTRVRFPGEDPLAGVVFRHAPALVDTVLPRPPTVESEDENPGDDESDDEGDDGGDSR